MIPDVAGLRRFNVFRNAHLSKSIVIGCLGIAALFTVMPFSLARAVTAESLLAQASNFLPSSIEGDIQATLEKPGPAQKMLANYPATKEFYAERRYRPYWVRRGGPNGQAEELRDLIHDSWSHGLNPEKYHMGAIEDLWEADEPQALAGLELLLSDAYVRMAQDLSGIRVNPAPLKTSSRFWKQPYTAQSLFLMLSRARDVEDLVEGLQPQGQTYTKLRAELRRLVSSPPESYESVLPIRIQGVLRPYESSKAVPLLRYRLGLPENTAQPYVYDDQLAGAIMAFQKQNGLMSDGLIGQQTLDILNITRDRKIYQVIANLERLRWVDENKPDKFVVVNIPSATLWAVDGGKVAFEMPVIVGRAKRPTNMFITEIQGVRFNPNWTVPPTIKKDDILPKLQADPEYLSHKGMELIGMTEEGRVSLDPASIDWASITAEDLKSLRFVQDAGDNNPLGRVRVLMPNAYNIYLHDTNEKYYFDRSQRAVSSGCVRMKAPELMAEFIMKNRSSWQEGDMEAMFAHGKTRDVSIDTPIPVYLLYYTVWIDQKGGVVYGNDLYRHDENLIKMLSELDGIFIPVNNNEMSMANSVR